MNEREWLACEDPRPMLRSLTQRWWAQRRMGKVVPFERLRLFACACLRRVWDLLDSDHRKAVEMIEDYARAPTPGGLRAARKVRWEAGNRASAEVTRVWRESPRDPRACLTAWARNVASSAVWQAADKKPTTAANCHWEAAQAVEADRRSRILPTPPRETVYSDLTPGEELAAQGALLRDVVGNPFRPATLEPAWLTPAVGSLAAGIDAERAFDRLPILADALEEAGCTDEDVLDHCRRPGVHALGCWVVDLLLKKT
jgi:hypothetical protein